jgi:hypothetical protein
MHWSWPRSKSRLFQWFHGQGTSLQHSIESVPNTAVRLGLIFFRANIDNREQILDIITTFFNAGKTKNVAPLSVIQLDDPRFSAYSDVPLFDLKDFATTALEQLKFVSISDYDFELKKPLATPMERKIIVSCAIAFTSSLL